MAVEELQSTPGASNSVLEIHRLGLLGTRLQVEGLMNEVIQMQQLQGQVDQEFAQYRAKTEEALDEAHANVTKLTSEVAECKDIVRVLENDRRRSILGRQASEVVKTKMKLLTFTQMVALIRLTSMVRGFLGRARVRRIKTSHLALEVGVLFAMASTLQGMFVVWKRCDVFDSKMLVRPHPVRWCFNLCKNVS
jgi:uncharacterized protein (DUF1810 family)